LVSSVSSTCRWPGRISGARSDSRRPAGVRKRSALPRLSSRDGLIHPSEPGQVSRLESGARTGASSCREQPPLPTLTGFEFIAEGVASRSRTNSRSSMLHETSAAGTTAASTSIGASAAPAQQPADPRERQSDGRNSEANRKKPIAAFIARGMKTCRRRKPLDARMIGRQVKDGPKRTALENLETAGAQQAHN
jgi:hypothetical protein